MKALWDRFVTAMCLFGVVAIIWAFPTVARSVHRDQEILNAYQAGTIQPCSRREAMTIAVLRERPKPSEPDADQRNDGGFRVEPEPESTPVPFVEPEPTTDVPTRQWWPLAGYPGYQVFGAKNADGYVVAEQYWPSYPVAAYSYQPPGQCYNGQCPR